MSVDARKIFDSKDDTTKAKLAELNAGLIDGIFATAVSQDIKNTDYSGDPTSGSIRVNRFVNAESEDYGTARGKSAGKSVHNAGKVIVNVDKDKEIIEEFENKDIALFGISDLITRRADNIRKKVASVLDREFFKVAETEATEVTLTTQTTVEDKLEAMIAGSLTVKNDYVDGQDKEDLIISLSPKAYGKVRNHIDKIAQGNTDSGVREIAMFHGVEVREAVRQEADVIIQRRGSIAMPVVIDEYELEKVPFSNSHALQLFYSYGVKAVTPDLIFKGTL